MKKETKAKLWERIGKEYIEGEDLVTYESLAQKYGYSSQTVTRYGAKDKGNWVDRRATYRIQKRSQIVEKKEEKTKKMEELFDKTKAEIRSLEFLDWFLDEVKSKRAKAELMSKMTFRDFKDLIILAGKIREGVGYADKVVVVKAPNMEQIRDSYAYKLGYNEAILENQKHLPKNVVNAQFSVIDEELPLLS